MTTVREHSACLNDPLADTDDSDEEQQLQRFNRRSQMVQQPMWICVDPTTNLASMLHCHGEREEMLEREMSLMHISDDQLDQLVLPGAVTSHTKSTYPQEGVYENEASEDSGSTLGNQSIDNVDTLISEDSAITTSVDVSFHNDGNSGAFHQSRLPEDSFLRRRRPEHNIAETSSLLSNDSQCTIIYVPSAIRELTPARNSFGFDQSITAAPDQDSQEGNQEVCQSGSSSPELTDSSLVDVSSNAVSSFSGSPAGARGQHIALPEALRQRLLDSASNRDTVRGSSPASSASSWEILSSPEDIVSMSTSPHSMDTSIVLEPYPPFDEYNRYTIRYMNMNAIGQPVGQMSDPPPSEFSDSGWTEGDTPSEDAYVEI